MHFFDFARPAALAVALLLCPHVLPADWPTYRGDNARTAGASETVPTPLDVRWKFQSSAPRQSAWSGGERERVIEGKLLGERDQYDDAFHPAIVDGKVYFGSSVDHRLRCVDLDSGRVLWTFVTGGPIRLAPTVEHGRVYFGSDDGRAYCLDAATGREIWQVRGAPAEEWLLARGEMISRWPVRTGVLIADGAAYFGAGLFPHEDVYLLAVEAATGRVLWKQDTISTRDAGRDDLSPQGYLLAENDLLFVPSGRSMPAVFNRRTGELLHKESYSWRTTAGGIIGGTRALLADGQLYASGPHHLMAIDQRTGDEGFGWFAGREMAIQGDAAYVATGTTLARLDRSAYAVNSRRRHDWEIELYGLTKRLSGENSQSAELLRQIEQLKQQLAETADVGIQWKVSTEDASSLLATEEALFAGGIGHVVAYSSTDGRELWREDMPGEVRGLAAASGRLLVSTRSGDVYCFAPRTGAASEPVVVAEPELAAEAAESRATPDAEVYSHAADDILRHTGVRSGFCLIVGLDHGELARHLAELSELRIYCIEPDEAKAAEARKHLIAAGLYGSRVVVHAFPYDAIPYSNYFANLIVSESLIATGKVPCSPGLLARHLKPLGGALCLGRPASDSRKMIEAARLSAWIEEGGLKDQSQTAAAPGWAWLVRGPLPGAGNWSHQYGNPANTAISDDTRVKGGLGLLWFGDPGPGDMVNRHDAAVGPLAVDGRLFVQGDTTIKAFDAYNGLHLWTYDNPDALRTGVFQNQNPGNLAVGTNRLFHFVKGKCFELEAATGKVVRVHSLPEGIDDDVNEWGYVAVQDGVLFGTATLRQEVEAQRRRRGKATDDATDALFAIDVPTGRRLWTYRGKSISHHTIALGPDRVCFIDSSITSEQREAILRQDKSDLAKLTGREREIAEERAKNADVRMAVALDSRTGKQLWAEPVDLTDCSEIGTGGGKLTLMYHDGVLVLCGANANGHFWPQFVAGEFERRRLVALSAADGYKLWARDANYRHRPVVIGREIIAEPWKFDLHTGEQLTREHPLTGEEVPWSLMRTGHHCGMLTGCDSGMILFRSGFTGYYDLEADAGVEHFAGHRLGCWINAIPANGLVMIPEASAGCVCLFSIASTVVMEPRAPRHPWTISSAVGAQTPVRHMAINLGAPGDRKDDAGTIWFSYPRREAYKETSLDVKLALSPRFAGDKTYRLVSESSIDASVDRPWLYSSWAEGLDKISLPLLADGDAPANYTIRLYLADLRPGDQSPVSFDVQMQRRTVLENVRPQKPGPGAQLVWEIPHVAVEGDLRIEFSAREGLPLLNAIEAIRE